MLRRDSFLLSTIWQIQSQHWAQSYRGGSFTHPIVITGQCLTLPDVYQDFCNEVQFKRPDRQHQWEFEQRTFRLTESAPLDLWAILSPTRLKGGWKKGELGWELFLKNNHLRFISTRSSYIVDMGSFCHGMKDIDFLGLTVVFMAHCFYNLPGFLPIFVFAVIYPIQKYLIICSRSGEHYGTINSPGIQAPDTPS